MDSKFLVGSIAIICISIMDIVALIMGVDGTFMITCTTIIGAIVGGLFGFSLGLKRGE